MGSPSGEVCLDNITVTMSTGPVWVIFKLEKEDRGEKDLQYRQQSAMRANGRRNSL